MVTSPSREFTAFWLDGDDRVLAGMNVNIWEGLDDIKALIRSRAPLGRRLIAPNTAGAVGGHGRFPGACGLLGGPP